MNESEIKERENVVSYLRRLSDSCLSEDTFLDYDCRVGKPFCKLFVLGKDDVYSCKFLSDDRVKVVDSDHVVERNVCLRPVVDNIISKRYCFGR